MSIDSFLLKVANVFLRCFCIRRYTVEDKPLLDKNLKDKYKDI